MKGEDQLRAAIQRQRDRARKSDPTPYDNAWGWWIEQRLKRLETGQKWLLRLAAGALAGEVIRIVINTIYGQ